MPEVPASVSRWRRRLATALDVLMALALMVAAGLAWTGAVRLSGFGIHFSARGPGRALVAAGMLIALRVAVAPRVPWPTPLLSAVLAAPRRAYAAAADAANEERLFDRATWIALIGLIAATVVMLWPQIRDPHAVPDLGDPLFSMWRIGWVQEQLHGDPRALFDANIFHPEPLTLTYSDAMLLPAVAATPLLALGLSPVVSYNILLVTGFVLSAATMFLLARALTGSAPAAFVAALIFGFYPYRFEHYGHLELQMTMWMPLGLLALHRFVRTQRAVLAYAAALCAVAQLYSSMYYGVFFAMYAAAVAVALVLLVRPPLRRVAAPTVGAAVLAVTLAIPLARPYVASTAVKGERGRGEVATYSATPGDYLRAQRHSVLYGRRLLPGRQGERALFPGTVALTLAAVGLTPPIGAARLAYLIGLAVAVDGSLGFNGVGWSALYDHLSVIRGLRVPARFSILVGLSLAVLGAFGARRLFGRVARPWLRRAAIALAIGLTLLDLRSTLALQPVWPEPPPIYAAIAGRRDVVLAEFPMTDNYGDNTPYLYFSLWHWAPIANGYSGFAPASYFRFQAAVASFPDADAFDGLRAHGVTHVTVNCGLYRGPCDGLLAALDARPDLRLVSSGRWRDQPVRLYQLGPR